MEFNLFLWPMIIPMLIPIFYCIFNNKKSCVRIGLITVIMIFIVIFYWPFVNSDIFGDFTYIITKFFLFVLLPIIVIRFLDEKKSTINLTKFGLKKQGLKKSVKYFIFFIPVMIITTIFVQYIHGINSDINITQAIILFFEAFNEEFFFRGVLFIYLTKLTDLRIAYITSLASFILIHPQNLNKILILGTIVQGILTIEICRKTNNLVGAWLLHGFNRFFSLAIYPLLF